jgi:hypothetical protein
LLLLNQRKLCLEIVILVCLLFHSYLIFVLSGDISAGGTLFWHEQTQIPSVLLVKRSLDLLLIGIRQALHQEER